MFVAPDPLRLSLPFRPLFVISWFLVAFMVFFQLLFRYLLSSATTHANLCMNK